VNALEGLREHSIIVADTAEYKIISKYKPEDVTTNPVLISQAAQNPEYSQHIEEAIKYAKIQSPYIDFTNQSKTEKKEILLRVYEKLAVSFGVEILKIIPGWVSTQLDPRMAYDKEGMLASARRMAKLYEENGWSRERFMIKVPSTWEGIQVAKELEGEGIHVNMTLMFSFAQAIASSDAGATMISPYVARIQDWWVLNHNKNYTIQEHPGLLKVADIWRYFKTFNLKTAILVANCRKGDEVLELSGCDRHTIGPSVLEELMSKKETEVLRKCKVEDLGNYHSERIEVPDEKTFRWMLNEDAAAYEKLGDGLCKFAVEMENLDNFIVSKL